MSVEPYAIMASATESSIASSNSSYYDITINTSVDNVTTEKIVNNIVKIAKQHVVYKLCMYVHTYWLASIIIIGIIGNSISLVVMLQVGFHGNKISLIVTVMLQVGIHDPVSEPGLIPYGICKGNPGHSGVTLGKGKPSKITYESH